MSNTPLLGHEAVPPPRAGKRDALCHEEAVILQMEWADADPKAWSRPLLSSSKPTPSRLFISWTRHTFFWTACLCLSLYWTFLHGLLPTSLLSDADGTNASSWHQYVRAPPSRTVSPRAILTQYTTGNVTNAEALVDGSGELAYLTRANNTSEVPTLVIDFGQNVVGLLEIGFAGSVSYTAQGYPGLKLSFSETLEYLTNRSDFTRSDNGEGASKITNGTDQIAVQPGSYTWLDQWGCEFGNQVCSDGLHGFRYVKIELGALDSDTPHTASAGSIAMASIRLQWSGYLGTPDTFTGWFECSDERLTQWWFDGAYTTEMNIDIFRANDTEPRDATSPSLLGKVVIHDGPKRDRDPYMGDLAVSALTSYLTHDVQTSARNVLEDLIQHQRSDGWIPPASIRNYELPLFDYPLWWVSCSWEYVHYTGNLSYIESYYTNMKLLLDDYYPIYTDSNTSLLVRPDGYGDYAFLQRPGSAAYYSALYVLALTRAADLADNLSRAADSARWRQRAGDVAQAFVSVLWDSSVAAFFDRRCTTTDCTAHAQDGNSLAILSGIITSNSSTASSILAYLSKANSYPYGNSFYDAGGDALAGCAGCSQRVYPFISYFEIAARFEAGQASSALEQLRRMHGWMASRDPGITFWEGIGADGVPYEAGFTSMAHGWSTGIVPLLSNYVLGVKPVKPGFEEWSVRPNTGDLDWARGVVPTPQGDISVQWTLDGTGIDLCVDAPPSTHGVIGVPSDGFSSSRIMVNGELVWAQGSRIGTKATLVNENIEIKVVGGEEKSTTCLGH
ncbi:putative Glycoside hydrolase family 78 protein [Seiridium cardinale]